MVAVFSDARSSSTIRAVVVGAQSVASVEQLIKPLPERTGFALILVGPLGHRLTAALRAVSKLPLVEVRASAALELDHVYILPANAQGRFTRGELVVGASDTPAPLDRLLRSAADELGGQAAGVVLSGGGADGVIGIKRLKESGGLTIAQQVPDDDEGGAPRAAIATGMVDLVLPVAEIAQRLVSFGRPVVERPADDIDRHGTEGVADTLRDILALVRIRSGHDFGSYKRATLYRRVSRRMQVCQCESVAKYHQHLRDHPHELSNLLRDFLISVTNFFRDRSAFDALATNTIPRLFAGKTGSDQVRVWVAGCATGEEAYSIGILLYEHALGLSNAPQLQIFATDIDEDALGEARIGRYPSTIAADVSPERLQRFFIQDNDSYRVTKDLREIVLFSPHNVLRDPPFSRLDLISCRNLLIYLNRDAQDRVLNLFHFGLCADGYLFLGSSESAENTAMFSGLDVKHRVFIRRPNASRSLGDALVTTGRWHPPSPPPTAVTDRPPAGELHHRIVEQYAPPSILLDDALDIVHVSEHAARLLQVAGGEPSRQLLRLIHPALRSDLRTAIYAARQNTTRSNARTVQFNDAGRPREITIRVRAIEQGERAGGSLLVMFDEHEPSTIESTRDPAPEPMLEPLMREIEDELRRTREQLRTTIEQYETSLEELKASNEELQAINEELQSASEELETSKEELQSVNEELTTLNHELKLKVDEVSHANSDLQNLMTSTDIGVVFLDRALNIKRFTPRVRDLINVIPSDIGRPLAHLTHRLDADDLPQLAESVLQTLRTIELEISSRDGSRYLARLLPYRSLEDRIDGVVLTFLEMTDLRNAIDARRRTEAALLASEERLRFALRSAPILVVSQDAQLRTTWGFVLGEQLPVGSPGFTELLVEGHAARFAEIARQVLGTGEGQRTELDVVIKGDQRTYDFRIERNEAGIGAVGFDITPSKIAEAVLLDADRRKDEFLATLSHELRNPLTPLKVALDIAKLSIDDPARMAHSRGVMERQVALLSQLVDDLLDLSRITQNKIEIARVSVDPVRVAESAIEMARPLLQQRHHELTIQLPSRQCSILGDPGRLTQVLVNLLNNSAKYTPEGGKIELHVELDAIRKLVYLRVRDNGDGISADMIPRIFDIFVQSRDIPERALNGLGIGLNLVRRLVELHDGTVSASSAGLHRGSEFVVTLPLHLANS